MSKFILSMFLHLSTILSLLIVCAYTTSLENDEVTVSIDYLKLLELKLARLEEKLNQATGSVSSNDARADPLPRSCFEAMTSNPSMESGTYMIDPDGSNTGDGPISVYCNVTTGYTSISHDSEYKTATSMCTGPGCYIKNVGYTASVKQMRALIDISKECRQLIEVECMAAPFEYEETEYSYWKDVNGIIQNFWAGDKTDVHTCQCGIDRNCQTNQYALPTQGLKCNCDNNSSAPQIDSGFISNKDLLPVTELYFGKYQIKGSNIWHTLGQLECSGKEEVTKGKMPTSCEELALIGHSLNGFYAVQGEGKKKIETVYCDFNLSPNTEGFEKRLGFVQVFKELKRNPSSCIDLFLNGYAVNGLYSVKGTGKMKMEIVKCNFDLNPINPAFEKRLGFVPVFDEHIANPASCRELKLNGHSVNGFYSIQPKLNQIASFLNASSNLTVKEDFIKKVGLVYCNFDLEPDTDGFERLIGFQQTKSSQTGVSFYVQNTNDYSNEDTRIKFDVVKSNDGNGMNAQTGLFTAPVSGRYFFSFSGVKEDRDGFSGSDKHMAVSLRRNGVVQGYAAGAKYKRPPPPKCRSIRSCAERARYFLRQLDTSLFNEFDYTFSIQGTFDLRKGETVEVYLEQGEIKGNRYNHFTGFLLDEDLDV